MIGVMASETTYVLGTTILGYSETSSWGDGETVDTNTSYYDADRGHVGHSYSNQWGEGHTLCLLL